MYFLSKKKNPSIHDRRVRQQKNKHINALAPSPSLVGFGSSQQVVLLTPFHRLPHLPRILPVVLRGSLNVTAAGPCRISTGFSLRP